MLVAVMVGASSREMPNGYVAVNSCGASTLYVDVANDVYPNAAFMTYPNNSCSASGVLSATVEYTNALAGLVVSTWNFTVGNCSFVTSMLDK